MSEKVCRECHRITLSQVCSVCGSSDISSDWSGLVIIIDPKRSKIAEKIGIEMPDKYALKVR